MERFAHELSRRIAVQLDYDPDKEAVIAYGLTAIFQIAVIALLISVIGILLDCLYEALLIYLGVGILKKSTGGAHSRSIYSCTLISTVSISLLALLSRYVFGDPMNVYLRCCIALSVCAVSLLIFKKYVPVDSPNKPIKKPEKIKRLRRQSFILLALYGLLACFFIFYAPQGRRFYSLTFCIFFILLWQSAMLTGGGMRFISWIDSKFNAKEV